MQMNFDKGSAILYILYKVIISEGSGLCFKILLWTALNMESSNYSLRCGSGSDWKNFMVLSFSTAKDFSDFYLHREKALNNQPNAKVSNQIWGGLGWFELASFTRCIICLRTKSQRISDPNFH